MGDATFICGTCRKNVSGAARACPACGAAFAGEPGAAEPADEAAAAPAYSKGPDGARMVSFLAAVAAAGCYVAIAVACASGGAADLALGYWLGTFVWNMAPSLIPCFATGPAQAPAFKSWVAGAAALVAALWFFNLLHYLSKGSCHQELGWLLMLGPVLYGGIVTAGIVAGAIAAAIGSRRPGS